MYKVRKREDVQITQYVVCSMQMIFICRTKKLAVLNQKKIEGPACQVSLRPFLVSLACCSSSMSFLPVKPMTKIIHGFIKTSRALDGLAEVFLIFQVLNGLTLKFLGILG